MPVNKKLISRKNKIDPKKVFQAIESCLRDVSKCLQNIAKLLNLQYCKKWLY